MADVYGRLIGVNFALARWEWIAGPPVHRLAAGRHRRPQKVTAAHY